MTIEGQRDRSHLRRTVNVATTVELAPHRQKRGLLHVARGLLGIPGEQGRHGIHGRREVRDSRHDSGTLGEGEPARDQGAGVDRQAARLPDLTLSAASSNASRNAVAFAP